jgi:hypothetical protein
MSPNPYAVQLGNRDAVAVIESTPARLRDLAGAIGTARLTAPRAPGKWSPRDILCHLADGEIVFAFRLRQTLAEDNPVVQPYDQDRWASPYAKQSADEALATFTALRAWNLALVRSLPPGARERKMRHPEHGVITFQTVLETMAGHDLNHVAQFEELAGGAR